MKNVILPVLLLVVLLFGACRTPEGSSSVVLDGPVLESVNKEGNLEFNGVIVNTGNKPVQFVEVLVVLKDDSGKILEAVSLPVLGDDPQSILYPSERAFFTITTKTDPGKVTTRDVEVYYEETSDDLPPSS